MSNQENKLQKMLGEEKESYYGSKENAVWYNDGIRDCKAILGKVGLDEEGIYEQICDMEIISNDIAGEIAKSIASNFQELLKLNDQ